ncbi:MAG: DUF4276 family protein [Verrucomicrobiota bacterium]
MSAIIYLEGGGDSKELHARCREGFRRLLERCGFEATRRMPRLVACGARDMAYRDFSFAHAEKSADFIAMWIDSEDVLDDLEAAWAHLEARDGWDPPEGAADEQVLFMTTCMETWIVADRATLREHYGNGLQENALPALVDLEQRLRDQVQEALCHATRNCGNAYQKGKRSFEVFGRLNPDVLANHLPSFLRVRRILDAKL